MLVLGFTFHSLINVDICIGAKDASLCAGEGN